VQEDIDAYNARLDEMLRKYGNKSFVCDSPCQLVTVVMLLTHPCKGTVLSVANCGHAGIGVGNNFYDFGPGDITPGPGSQFWSDTYPTLESLYPFLATLQEASVVFEFCACKGRSEFITNYFDGLEKERPNYNAEDPTKPIRQCCTAVTFSLFLTPMFCGGNSNGLLSRLLGTLDDQPYTHKCGPDKGKAGNFKILNKAK
jgi:hypothetical protein